MSKRSIDIDTDTVSKLRKVEIQIPEITSIEHFKEVCKTTTKDYIVFDFYLVLSVRSVLVDDSCVRTRQARSGSAQTRKGGDDDVGRVEHSQI